MRRAVLLSMLVAALVLGLTPANAGRTVKSGQMAWRAPVPCGAVCAYWLDNANGLDPSIAFEACTHPFPEGAYADKVLKAPKGSKFLVVRAFPQVDWDLFLCAKPKKGNNGKLLSQAANTADVCQVACVETLRYPVKPGRSYVVRAYNWSDIPDLTGRYWFKT